MRNRLRNLAQRSRRHRARPVRKLHRPKIPAGLAALAVMRISDIAARALAEQAARAPAEQKEDVGLCAHSATMPEALASNGDKIVYELNSADGAAVDIGGYLMPTSELASAVMGPSATLNESIAGA